MTCLAGGALAAWPATAAAASTIDALAIFMGVPLSLMEA